MSENIAIKVDGVYKNFKLPQQRANSVKSLFTGFYKKNTVKYTETQHALRDINFDIKEGEFFGIVGRNGSGKSTLLKILASIYQPTKGKVSIKGKLVPFIELGVGFNPELTGRENVYLNGALLGFNKKKIDSMYKDIVSFAELEKFMDQKLKNYSSGMQVRLAFSMATRSDADILLIDEVLAVGDTAFQRKCFEYFNQLKRAKKTVVFVSHDMDAVSKYCDRAMLIENSKLVDVGETLKIADKYVRLFSNNKTPENSGSTSSRWGDKNLVIESIFTEVSDSIITIRQAIKANKSVENISSGIRIKSSTGVPVTGTSTTIEHLKIPKMQKGDRILLEWKLPNVLSDGKYLIDPAVSYEDGTTADWWNEAASFSVKKKRSIPYPIDPDIKVKLV